VFGSHATLDDAELRRRYTEYLERFAREVGDVEVGAFAKYAGHLIKKLEFEEFAPAQIEYEELLKHYLDSLARGDTINNIVCKLLRERGASLVVTPPTL
jgi:hypothetical protein